jgi:hypothetical protein
MIINRIWEMPNKWTFQMQCVQSLLLKYNVGKNWIDPFSGMTSPAEIRNDLNLDSPAEYHLKADDFISQLKSKYTGVLFDPPYSLRQVKECYESHGIKFTQWDTQESIRWNTLRDSISEKILPAGYCINFGWNSSGMGLSRGFNIIEILLICHGGAHNDTIITVEQKSEQESLF